MTAKKKNPGGRPPYKPTEEERDLVRKVAGFGLTQEDICQLLINDQTKKPINRETFQKYFLSEFDAGKVIAKSKVARSAYQQAISGSVPAMTMFWLKTQCGWRERQDIALTDGDGNPLQAPQTIVILPAKKTDG